MHEHTIEKNVISIPMQARASKKVMKGKHRIMQASSMHVCMHSAFIFHHT